MCADIVTPQATVNKQTPQELYSSNSCSAFLIYVYCHLYVLTVSPRRWCKRHFVIFLYASYVALWNSLMV